MFFDCSALVIGLYGSFMSSWAPNDRCFAFGYTQASFVRIFYSFSAIFRAVDTLSAMADTKSFPVSQTASCLCLSA